MTVRDESIHDDGGPCRYVAGACNLCGATQPTEHDHEDNCLMCAVRALTEGDPAATWMPETEGQTVSGVVLRMGELATGFGKVLFVDLWTGGTGRVRVKAFGSPLRHAIESAAPQVGDRLSVWFNGDRLIMDGKWAGRSIKTFSVNVQRGH